MGHCARLPDANDASNHIIEEGESNVVESPDNVENYDDNVADFGDDYAENDNNEDYYSEVDDYNEYQPVSDDEEEADLPQFQGHNGEISYCQLQETLYRSSFDVRSLYDSKDMDTFLQYLPTYTEKQQLRSKLLHFKNHAGLSRSSGNELLHLLSSSGVKNVPSDWRTIGRYLEKKVDFLKPSTLRSVVPWPEDWCMHLFDEAGQDAPPEIELIARDPLELIALKLVDPTLQYLYKDDISYEYTSECLDDGTPCSSNLMSSTYAKETEASIRTLNPDGILLPVITYADGVSLGVRNKVC